MNKATQAYYNFLLNRTDILEQLCEEYDKYKTLQHHDHMYLLTCDLRRLLDTIDDALMYDEETSFQGNLQLVFDLLYAVIDQIDYAEIARNLVSFWEV